MSKKKIEQFDIDSYMNNSERKTVKRTSKYTVLLIPDSTDHSKTFELTFDRILRVIVAIIAVGIILTSMLISSALKNYRLSHDDTNLRKIDQLNEDIEQLKSEKAEMYEEIVSLTGILSDKQEEEEKQAAERLAEMIPNDSPIKGIYIEVQDPTVGDGEKVKGRVVYNVMEGSAIVAASGGTVTMREEDLDFGTVVKIDHGNGYETVYRNSGNCQVKVGDVVGRRETLFVIAREEDGIFAYEVIQDGNYIEPQEIMNN